MIAGVDTYDILAGLPKWDFAELLDANRVFVIGNGGSYANAIHIANDLISVGVDASTLDPATLTAIANDYGYEEIFSRWLGLAGTPDDLLIALSGSGTSPNILRAIAKAENIGMRVWRVFGSGDMQKDEEQQICLGHRAMRWLKNR